MPVKCMDEIVYHFYITHTRLNRSMYGKTILFGNTISQFPKIVIPRTISYIVSYVNCCIWPRVLCYTLNSFLPISYPLNASSPPHDILLRNPELQAITKGEDGSDGWPTSKLGPQYVFRSHLCSAATPPTHLST
jgi:hypothetical protein